MAEAEPSPTRHPMAAPDSAGDARRRLADALRVLVERAATLEVPPEDLEADITALEDLAGRLAPHTDPGPFRVRSPRALRRLWDRNPMVGRLNPLAPPIVTEIRGSEVHGWVTLGPSYEGPPGYAHGGVVASCFDQLLGMASAAAGAPGMTASLTIRYHQPTPLRKRLHFRCRTIRIDGRKSFAEGMCTAGGELTAEAEGLFISLEPEKAEELFSERRGRKL